MQHDIVDSLIKEHYWNIVSRRSISRTEADDDNDVNSYQ